MSHTTAAYDDTNIFARILRGEIPCDKVFEDEHVLAFRDIAPQAPVHVLVIPKFPATTLADFCARAEPAMVAAWTAALPRVAEDLGLTADGYRVIINTNAHGGQEVFHLHAHILGGRPLGRMLPAVD